MFAGLKAFEHNPKKADWNEAVSVISINRAAAFSHIKAKPVLVCFIVSSPSN